MLEQSETKMEGQFLFNHHVDQIALVLFEFQ